MIDLVRTHASFAGAALIAYLSYASLDAEAAKDSNEAASKREVIGAWYLGVADASVARPELRDPCGIMPKPEDEATDEEAGTGEDGDVERGDGESGASGGAPSGPIGPDGRPIAIDPAVVDMAVSSSTGADAVTLSERTSFTLELQATLMLGRHARARISGHDVAVGDEIPVDGIDRPPPVVLSVTATTVEIEWIDQTYELDLDGASTVVLGIPRDEEADAGFGFGSFLDWGSDG